MTTINADYFRAIEAPRLALLAPNLVAAVFPLMKLLPARYILDRASAEGILPAGARIVETTSGTFGMALAMLSAARGYRLTLVTAASLIDGRFAGHLRRLGADLVVTQDPHRNGDQQQRLVEVRRFQHLEPDCFWPNQYDNPANALAYARLAETFVRSAGKIDVLVGCVGSGGSLCGAGYFLREVFPHLKIIAVDTHRSVLFGQPSGARMLRGLGNSVLPRNVNHELIDEVHWMGAYPAFREANGLMREHGLFQGPTSAAAALVGKWAARNDPDARVAVIMPDAGYRYIDTVFNDAWLSALPRWNEQRQLAPRLIKTVAPASEEEWTRLEWARRKVEDVMSGAEAPQAQAPKH